MTSSFSRALLGAFAILFAAATFNVGRAIAQAVPTTGTSVTTTECGAGSLVQCGREDILHCSWRFEINLDLLTRGGGLRIGRYECVKAGYRNLYKDQVLAPAVRSCPVLGRGSDGSTGGWDDADDASCS
jgi:hypothetical protein